MRKYLKHSSKQKTNSATDKSCARCGRFGGHVGKYGMKLCRHCFREIATEIGFKKYN